MLELEKMNITHFAYRYEPSRRIKLHKQLVRARRLRAIIEDAAERADALPDSSSASYSQAMEILQSTVPYINELTRLTEALHGNYTLEDEEYNEWNEWVAMKNKTEKEKLLRDERILRRELREWGKETNPNFEMDDELEQRHDSLICKSGIEPKNAESAEEAKHSNDKKFTESPMRECRDRHINETQLVTMKLRSRESEDSSKQPSMSKVKSKKSDDKNNQTAVKELKRKKSHDTDNQPSIRKVGRFKSNDRHNKNDAHTPLKRPSTDAKQSSKKKKNTIERAQLKDPPELLLQESTKPSQPNHAANVRAAKKCHDCREVKTRCRRCSYWQVTGTKCGKFFCVDCLSSKYSVGDDVFSESNPKGIPLNKIFENWKYDSEWHCPSCLKTCLCAVCIKQRQREEEKEKSREQGERRSSRRSTEQSDYSNFFQARGGGILF